MSIFRTNTFAAYLANLTTYVSNKLLLVIMFLCNPFSPLPITRSVTWTWWFMIKTIEVLYDQNANHCIIQLSRHDIVNYWRRVRVLRRMLDCTPRFQKILQKNSSKNQILHTFSLFGQNWFKMISVSTIKGLLLSGKYEEVWNLMAKHFESSEKSDLTAAGKVLALVRQCSYNLFTYLL